MKSLDPSLGVEAIRDILKNTSDDQVGDPSEDIAGWDEYHGAGRMNAGAAITYVQNSITSDEGVENPFTQIKISPNPSVDFVRINTNGKTIDQLNIYAINGQLIRQLNHIKSNENISVKDLQSGVYLFEIQVGEERVSKKIVVE